MAPRGGRGGQNRKKAKSNKDERRRKRNNHAVMTDILANLTMSTDDWKPGNRPFEISPDGKKLRVSTEKVTYLPESISTLDGLEILNLSDCSQLSELPDAIGELKALTHLSLKGCSSLAALPTMIGELKALTTLDLTACTSLTALPDAIGKLGALTTLNLDGCSNLTTLPDVIRTMPGLTICDSNSGLDKTRREKPEAALRCPISTALLVKPMRAKPCGHVYSEASVQGYYKGARKKCVVFGCQAMLSSSDFVWDMSAEAAMETYRKCLQGTADADEAADEALDELEVLRKLKETDRGQPREEHEAEVERKILEESEDKLSDAQRLELRRLRRRVCDACGRQGTLKEERFPVCWCGARRYCNEACQLVEWDRGHSATCASGHTFPQNLLNDLRVFYVDAESNKIFQKVAYEQYPPPADRVR